MGTQPLATRVLWHRKLFSSENKLGQMLILEDVDEEQKDQQAEETDPEQMHRRAMMQSKGQLGLKVMREPESSIAEPIRQRSFRKSPG